MTSPWPDVDLGHPRVHRAPEGFVVDTADGPALIRFTGKFPTPWGVSYLDGPVETLHQDDFEDAGTAIQRVLDAATPTTSEGGDQRDP